MTTIRVSQEEETRLSTEFTPFGTVMYLYARSTDSVSAGTIGQDYVTFRYDEANVAFAVCDGVGQSFMGDLAARILGDGLIDWLLDLRSKPADAGAFRTMVEGALADLTAVGRETVANYQLPDHLPPILKQALEMQRSYGSESMFVAGRLALRGDPPFLALAWLGDSPMAAIDFNGELVDLGPRGSTAARWNADTGVKGTVNTWVGAADAVARVAGYTDGMTIDSVPTDAVLSRLTTEWQSNPPADDASLVDIRLKPSPQTTGKDDPEHLVRIAEFVPDETRPIPLPGTLKQRTPTPEKPAPPEPDEQPEPASPAAPGQPVGEWRSLDESGEKVHKPPATADRAAARLEQIRAWQSAARERLIGARLALDQIERLLADNEDDQTST
ncbi:MAG: hypothetical protein GYB64_16155 [Chloroflexi bacterium]|nr:hypothetical protein [Chloroflexota bacterium]